MEQRCRWLVGFVGALLVAAPAWAQQASGIAGVVRDTSGAVLPGVTVEAASPVLIEKVRTVVSDGEGRYNIIDLRPGAYVVTFSLSGFNTLKREGIVLPAGFTATVNADLQVGSLEETITVSGSSPLVDTQNTNQTKVVSEELLSALPTSSKTVGSLINITPGLTGAQDVGGSAGTYATQGNNLGAHGKTGNKFSFDGMRTENMEGAGSAGYILNPLLVEETTIETAGVSAESNVSGIAVNAIPKEGGNSFRFSVTGMFANDKFQSDNLDDALRARGLTTQNKVLNLYDTGWTVGGPIRRDKVWFFAANRFWGNRNQVGGIYFNKTNGTPFYTPDLERPADRYEWYRSFAGRVTWQASQRNKFNFVADAQKACVCRREGFNAPEALVEWRFSPQGLYQATWSSPVTSKLLLEAGASATISHWPNFLQPGVRQDVIPITELSTGFFWNGPTATSQADPRDSDRFAQRFSMSYVTGSHTFKTGIQVEQGRRNTGFGICCPVLYSFRNGVPSSIEQRTTPYLARERIKADIGIFVQDQWSIRKLTVNAGLRFDHYNAAVLAQSAPATPFVPAREFPAVHGVPSWQDLNPRLGASYDIFGDGRTAIKASIGRYLGVSAVDVANANNPLITSVNTVTRSWTDTNADYVPDCNLASPLANGECG
ncbi:MAG: TonB-dependent receptor, partial [Luteitalea sp.]|nr:TonB-dependent receptor [Luteitalea sp.]